MLPDTIIAPATQVGGGLCVLRASGPLALPVLRALTGREAFESHRLYHARLRHAGKTLDDAMAVFMRGPRSYTREDVAELHCHGGKTVVESVLSACLALGCRMAEPGEFTRRAFENGRMDLPQAEAVMQIVGARSEAAARAAVAQLSGGASAFVGECLREMTGLLSAIDAAIDFPEEIDETMSAREVAASARAMIERLDAHIHPRAGKLLYEGLSLVIAGSPNVGKSTLLNALAGEERAIVTDIPGTTRDVLTIDLRIGDALFHVSDTAGLRESADAVEAIGIERARNRLESADIAVIVLDSSRPLGAEDEALLETTRRTPSVVLLNKTDKEAAPGLDAAAEKLDCVVLRTALNRGEGVPALCDALLELAGETEAESEWLIHARHVEAAKRAREYLVSAAEALDAGEILDLAAIDLRSALAALGEITGENVDEAIIDRIFADFCVGK